MKLSYLLVINAILAAFGGVGLLLIPNQLISPYGPTLNNAGIFMSQLLGAVLLGIATISWNARNIKTREEVKMILPGFFIAHLTAAFLGFMALSTGVLNSMVWIDISAHGLLAIGFGYYLSSKK